MAVETTDSTEPAPPESGGQDPPANERDHERARLEGAALREMLVPVRRPLHCAGVVQVVASAATVVPYLALAVLAAAVAAQPADAEAIRYAVIAGVAGLGLAALLTALALHITHLADAHLMGVLRGRLIATLGRVPLRWFDRRSSGRIRKVLEGDLTDLHYLVAHGRVETIGAVATPCFALAAAFAIDVRLGLLALVSVPVYGAVYGLMMRGMNVKLVEMDRALADVSAAVTEVVDGIHVVKGFSRTGRAHGRFSDAATAFGDFFAAWVRPMLRTDALTTMLIAPTTVLLINAAGGLAMIGAGWVEPAQVLATSVIAMVVPQAIQTIGSGMYARQTAAQAALRIHEVLSTPPLAEGHRENPVTGDVRFENVTFGYDPAEPVLHAVDLQVPQGTTTALVGPSGSGKSTLASLVARFGDPDSGTIAIGGVDLRDLTTPALYRSVGFLLQDAQLFGIPVADNIRLARPEASDDEVRAAAQQARIHSVIAALPRGYDSVIGEDAQLSGGEQQRVCIARTILADPPVLVLDEATSFLDPQSEAEVQRAIAEVATGRTVIVIAHRLRTVRGCDQIAVLDHGRVVEHGGHDDLLAAGGRYHRLWRITSENASTPDGSGT